MSYDKRVIVDFDDTIATTTTRDWENAEPIWSTINKMNSLYNLGWEIWIVTARGQLSCNGDWEKADKKYRNIIESWLSKHGVKYHKLRFEKFLASYYIDDKGLTPEDFSEIEIKEIKKGWSGASVEKRGDRIYKTHSDSLKAAEWYNMASPLINTPKVYSVVGNTICLEYLKSNENTFKLDDINNAIDKFSLYKYKKVNFSSYIDRVRNHCEANDDFWDIIPMLEDVDVLSFCDDNTSFMHGDLSLENMIQTEKGLFFIDPIYNTEQWSSYLLDISKMLHSYRKHNRMFEYEIFLNYWANKIDRENNIINEYNNSPSTKRILQILETTQWIRVCKYVPDKKLKSQIVSQTHELINYFKNAKK